MNRSTRRGFLAASVGVAGLTAGCLSNSGGSPSVPTAEGQPLPAPVAGDPDADVTVEVYEDYACPHCRTFSLEVYPQIRTNYLSSGSIEYVFNDFPIPVDDAVSWEAASAARAVQDRAGDEAFFTYNKRLFENQNRLGPSVYAELTEGMDVDGETIREEGVGEAYRPTVSEDRSAGRERGVSGTPTVFVDGEAVQWSEVAFGPVQQAIDAALDG
ncbi:DsbA family protein [Halomicroarcula sp. GCM10025709]|uniref:DsbA family protein n=1 Tax=Haloarcula TaxID=2237 RepID=UPI0024C264FF|nr:thioredoxin domain-containing protein [Halomicroarcula sp. YJ-61-S]